LYTGGVAEHSSETALHFFSGNIVMVTKISGTKYFNLGGNNYVKVSFSVIILGASFMMDL
jgi:hypothetical protein